MREGNREGGKERREAVARCDNLLRTAGLYVACRVHVPSIYVSKDCSTNELIAATESEQISSTTVTII